ncbi:MAG TPA: creatininase family protein [Humisphaera sp.]|jgi:creatinine amidohydrolase|nr:creatininase family protein [Humisphaera sp.]
MAGRPFILLEANYRQLKEYAPNVAVLPWGATEAHNYHLPHGTDVIEASAVAERGAAIAYDAGGKPLVLPAIPFGNNAQQLDQAATIHLSTTTAFAILLDVARSLKSQGIDRLVILNAHGGNDFKPLVRDIQTQTGVLLVVANFNQMCPKELDAIFDEPGDHAGEMETSLLLHLCPQWVELAQAGPGKRVPFAINGLSQPGVWTPRPWNAVHPDTGCGDPSCATADKGKQYLDAVAAALGSVLVALSRAKKGELPYL